MNNISTIMQAFLEALRRDAVPLLISIIVLVFFNNLANKIIDVLTNDILGEMKGMREEMKRVGDGITELNTKFDVFLKMQRKSGPGD